MDRRLNKVFHKDPALNLHEQYKSLRIRENLEELVSVLQADIDRKSDKRESDIIVSQDDLDHMQSLIQELDEFFTTNNSDYEMLSGILDGFNLYFDALPGGVNSESYSIRETRHSLAPILAACKKLVDSFQAFSLRSDEKARKIALSGPAKLAFHNLDSMCHSFESHKSLLEKISKNPFFDIKDPGGLVEKKKDVSSEMREAFSEKGKLQEQILNEMVRADRVFTFSRNEFADDRNQEDFEADIKIRYSRTKKQAELDGEQAVFELRVRNKTIADNVPRKVFQGDFQETEDMSRLEQFIRENDNRVGGLSSLKAAIEMFKDGEKNGNKIYTVEDSGRVVGVVHGPANGKNFHLSNLIVSHDCHGRGIGTRIIIELKSLYDLMRVAAVQHSLNDRTIEENQRRLERFYKQHGFIGAREWQREILSLDDLTEAGEWHDISDYDRPIIGVGNETMYLTDFSDKFITALSTCRDLVSDLALARPLDKWDQVNEKLDEAQKQMDLIHEVGRLKEVHNKV